MTTYVAFIRAINVAGHASVKMNELKRVFVAAGCGDVRTFVQSGNVLFEVPEPDAEAVFEKVRIELRKLLKAEPTVLFRKLREICRMVEQNPFKELDHDSDAKLYVTFLSRKPGAKPNFPIRSPKEGLEAIGVEDLEVFIVSRRKENGYFGFPNNFIEKELGVLATSRNRSTVKKVARMAEG